MATTSSGAFTGVLAFLAAGFTVMAIGGLVGSNAWAALAGWPLIVSAAIAWYTATALMVEPAQAHSDQRLQSETLQLVLLRCVDDGLLESFELTSYPREPLKCSWKSRSSRISPTSWKSGSAPDANWNPTDSNDKSAELTASYRHQDYTASLSYAVRCNNSGPAYGNGHVLGGSSVRLAAMVCAQPLSSQLGIRRCSLFELSGAPLRSRDTRSSFRRIKWRSALRRTDRAGRATAWTDTCNAA
ncbi:MAG: hypothetical protein JO057_29470 [Chloroflexi bacterium]|nr:hypothetical protein [Chloroflexota bacterium]